jgi:hypothetical protein
VRGKLLDDQAHTCAKYSPAFALQLEVVQPVLLGNLPWGA